MQFFVIWLCFMGNKFSLSKCQVLLTSQHMGKFINVQKNSLMTGVLISICSVLLSEKCNASTNTHAATWVQLSHLTASFERVRLWQKLWNVGTVARSTYGDFSQGLLLACSFSSRVCWTESFGQITHISWIPTGGVFHSQDSASKS